MRVEDKRIPQTQIGRNVLIICPCVADWEYDSLLSVLWLSFLCGLPGCELFFKYVFCTCRIFIGRKCDFFVCFICVYFLCVPGSKRGSTMTG